MGKSITVTPEELGTVSQKLRSQADTYTEIYKQLLQQASGMGDAWQGEDNLKFVDQINGFCQELQKMASKLTAASETLNKQKENYIARQEANVSAVTKLKN